MQAHRSLSGLLRCVAFLFALVAIFLPRINAQAGGLWHGAYDWQNGFSGRTLNTLHVGLIPRGPHAGHVVFLSWGYGPTNFTTRWGILDPESGTNPPTPTFYPPASASPNEWLMDGNKQGVAPHTGNPDAEMTCSGHAWTADGRWLVAGGIDAALGEAHGNNRVWIYDPAVTDFTWTISPPPPQGYWYLQTIPGKLMQRPRYYPTVILTGQDVNPDVNPGGDLIIAGGGHGTFAAPGFHDDYETFRPGARSWEPRPTEGTWRSVGQPPNPLLCLGPAGSQDRFEHYPRLVLLPEGHMALVGRSGQSSIAQHPTSSVQSWIYRGLRPLGTGWYQTAVLYPNFPGYENVVMNMGGYGGTNGKHVEWANPVSAGPDYFPWGHLWTDQGSPEAAPGPTIRPSDMAHPRLDCNAVILPDASIVVLGDGDNAATKIPELWKNGQWTPMDPEDSIRSHHAVALLLPSGRVLSAGGGGKPGSTDRSKDFQVYDPPYLTDPGSGTPPPRPAWGATIGNLSVNGRGQWMTVPITLPPGTSVGSVVLMRPGSLTHGADMDQRYISLPITDDGDPSQVIFRVPDGPPLVGSQQGYLAAPLGFYMIFLVTDGGIPSMAQFVRFQ